MTDFYRYLTTSPYLVDFYHMITLSHHSTIFILPFFPSFQRQKPTERPRSIHDIYIGFRLSV